MPNESDNLSINPELFSIVSSGNLDRLCLWFYERFQYPVAIIDSSFKHVSSAPQNRKIDDPYWDGIQAEGGIPAEEMASTYRYKYVEAMLTANDVIKIDWGDVKYPNLNGVLQWNKSVFGYSAVIYRDEHYPIKQAMQISRIFNKCALATLQSACNAMPKNASFIQFVFSSELMSGNLVSPEDLVYWRELTGIRFSGNYAVLRYNTTLDNAYKLENELTRRRIKHFPPERRDSENFDFLLYGFASQNDLAASVCSLQYCGKAAVSDLFDDLLNIGDYCEQARLTCEIARSKDALPEKVYFYKDWQSEILISLVRADVYHDENCKHEIISQLEKYDKMYGTDYADTLYAYLSNFFDVLKTANQIGIHRNTLQYRLAKINEICSCDLADGDTQYALLLSSAVLLGK